MIDTSHKSAKFNYFCTYIFGTSLVKGMRRHTCSRSSSLPRKELVMKSFTDHFSFIRKAISLCIITAFVFTNIVAVRTLAATSSTGSTLSTFSTDLTQLGREGRLRQSPNFEAEVNKVIEVLEKGGSRKPVIVDDNGSAQDEIVEQVAIRMSKGSVSDTLRKRKLIKLETTSMFSNSVDSAGLDAALSTIVEKAIASNGETILFVDDLSAFVSDPKNVLVSAIREGKVNVIGGSSRAAYSEKIEKDASLAVLFEVIEVKAAAPISNENANTAENSEGFRGDNISPDLREMMQKNPSGDKRVDVIVQAKDSKDGSLRALISEGHGQVRSRIGRDTFLVNLPLSALASLSASGRINYVSPDRPMQS